MRSPAELYTLHRDVSFVERPVLLYAFSGFVDAGHGVRLAAEHILATLEHELIATFDIDEVLDYRARRPAMTFVVDHYAAVDIPQIALHEVRDSSGTPFLLLLGPEPDYQWQRFIAAVHSLAERFDARMAVGLTAVPWPAPHTRPTGVLLHGSEPSLLQPYQSMIGEIEAPGHVAGMLELSMGEQGITSMGVTAQVPHYLVQFEYPQAAVALLRSVHDLTGLQIETASLAPASTKAEREISEQMEGNAEFVTVVAALEQQYDQLVAGATGNTGGLADLAPEGGMPSADEIAAQVEEFLQGLRDEGDPDK